MDNIATINLFIKAPLKKVWEYFTQPNHIVNWYFASNDWHTPYVENDLRTNGSFLFRMEAKDGSFGFDYTGVYDNVDLYETISYTLGDQRKVIINFSSQNNDTLINQVFELEKLNSRDIQEQGWLSILKNFKSYVELYIEQN